MGLDRKKFNVEKLEKQPGTDSHLNHVKNFFECITTRKDPVCSVDKGRLVALYAHAADIALRTNSRLVWDEKTNSFGDNEAANTLITPAYRKPWVLPTV